MSFDPYQEDYERMSLHFGRSLQGTDPFSAARARLSFERRLAQNRDKLPQSDEDRAFHLVARATDLLDYQLPFAPDERVEAILRDARGLIDEACEVDPTCHDALRMRNALEHNDPEAHYRFLADGADEVLRSCQQRRVDARRHYHGNAAVLAEDIALRPYLRWMAAYARLALMCGRYRECIRCTNDSLTHNTHDPCGIQKTALYAYAKLEDEAGLLNTVQHMYPSATADEVPQDPWVALAGIALAYSMRNFRQATQLLSRLLEWYPHAAATLSRQEEIETGLFGRLCVSPQGGDELILAVSEAAVLLQEGCTYTSPGPIGVWIASHPLVQAQVKHEWHNKSYGTTSNHNDTPGSGRVERPS